MSSRISLIPLLLFPVALCSCGPTQEAAVPLTQLSYTAAVAPRQAVELNSDWKFIRQDVAGAEQVEFDDSGWQSISLPHTWNNLDGEDGPDPKTGKANFYRGQCWYRRHINLAGYGLEGKSLFLKFDGSSITTHVFVNGTSVGPVHMGMFGAFCYDVTSLLNTAGDNVIAVAVDNMPNQDVAPLSADFTFFGGIYRSVHLLALSPLAIDPMDDASSGVYIQQTSVKPDSAALQITTRLRNDSAMDRSATVTCDILDATGTAVMTLIAPAAISAKSQTDSVLTTTIPNPHLWNGRKDPYLYRVRVSVSDGQTVTDRVIQPLGIRYFSVDPDKGFFLNGQSYSIHGVCRHQDREDMGWAITSKEHKEDFDLIMEMGCTGIRLAHYEHAQDFYDLCDQGGLIVWAEDGLVNSTTLDQAFDDNIKQQLRELIKQNYNHPSICFWSLFNELRDPDPKKGETQDPKPQFKHQIDLVTELNDMTHKLDPGRITTAATFRPSDNPLHRITDVIAFNRYNGWYRGTNNDWGPELDHIHQVMGSHPIAISEYGAGGSIYEYEPNPNRPPTSRPWHPEEYQCIVHEQAYAAMKDRPYLWATFLWNMFDFASDGRIEGDHMGINDKGMVTYDRKTKKDVFYFYKANWSDQPVVYITERRFTPRPMDDAPVKVYSNCDSVDLSINGVSQGARSADDHIFVWDNATLARGVNHLVASGMRAGQRYTDAVDIVYDPGVRIWKPVDPNPKPGSTKFEPAVDFNPNWPNP